MIKKYPAEIMCLLFAITFLILALISLSLPVIEVSLFNSTLELDPLLKYVPSYSKVIIPSPLALTSLIILLFGLISIFLYTHKKSSLDQLFIHISVMLASLSDGFWIFMLLAAVFLIIRRRNFISLKNKIFYAWFLLIFVSMLSAFFASDSKSLAFGAAFGLFVYFLLFIAVDVQDYSHNPDFVLRLAVLLSGSIIVSTLFSLWHFFFFPHTIDLLIFQFYPRTGYGNSFGMASLWGQWPTHSSAFLVMSFWVLIGILIQIPLPKPKKIIVSCGALFALIGTLATLSRNAFLFLTVSFFVFFVIILIKPIYKKFIVPTIFGGFTLIGTLYFYLMNFSKWRDLLSNPWQQSTIASRLEQYTLGWKYFLENDKPLLGIGLMNFAPMARRIENNPHIADYLHQLPLSFLLEIGYLGLFTFIVLLALIGKEIFKNNKSDVFKIIFISWLVMGMFDNWLYFMWSSTLFIIIIAVGSSRSIKE